MRFSIRDKILAVVGLLLLLAVGFYTVLASFIFSEQKTALLYDLNHSIAVNTASQLRANLTQLGSELRLYAVSQILSRDSTFRLPSDFIKGLSVSKVALFRKNGTSFVQTANEPPFASPGLEGLLKEAEAHDFAFSATFEKDIPHFSIAQHLSINAGGDTQSWVVAAETKREFLLRAVQASSLFQSYLTKADGSVLVFLDRGTVGNSPNIPDHPLLGKSKSGNATSGVSGFNYKGEDWYGAYAPLEMGDLFFLSQASQTEVTGAIQNLIKQSLLFGLIVITVTFIASVLFSKRLTRNLQTLTLSARRIEKGDLESKIMIRSRDEIQELASSFNSMMDSLKASRDEIERYNRELEDRVAERTHELHEANASIKSVQEKLLKTTQLAAVGEVAGRTAHEVLNPLTAILSRLERSRNLIQIEASGAAALPLQLGEILQAWETDFKQGGFEKLTGALKVPSSVKTGMTLFEEDIDNLKNLTQYWKNQTEVLAKDLDFLRDQSERIHRIVDGMRTVVRESVKANTNCGEAVKEAVVTMSDFLNKNAVAVDLKIKAEADEAILNRDELIQILTNLIRNAYQAIQGHKDPEKRKQGRIQIETSNSETHFLIRVTDNGTGIPDDKKTLLFEQGFTTKAPTEGTGLGLSICRRYARAFGGEVELVFSHPDKGTCFGVTVPLSQPLKKAS